MRCLSLLPLAAVLSSVAVADKWCLRQAGDMFSVESRACTPLETDLVEADYNKTYMKTGWDQLSISPLKIAAGRSTAYYHSGYLEGYLTYDTIWATYYNTVSQFSQIWDTNVTTWVDNHWNYIKNPPAATLANHPNFWPMINSLVNQIQGLKDGYNAAQTNASRQLNETQMFWMSFQLEFDDISTYYGWKYGGLDGVEAVDPSKKNKGMVSNRRGHCSALIRDAGDDLYMAHVTWTNFQYMLRQYKVYNFEPTVAMSGYPGCIHSIDDWYMTSNRLTVQETTNLMYNNSIYQYLSTNTVSEFLRVMAANYLADSAPQWVKIVGTQNSGTYNNQWMVVDQKLFVPGQTDPTLRVPDNTLWIYEQLPGPLARSMDVSKVLRDTGRWISYNLPYIPEVYNVSGNLMMETLYGSYYNYNGYARPEIFNREFKGINSMDDMKRIMRYNNFTNEPFSVIPPSTNHSTGKIWNNTKKTRSAMLTISSRGDIDPPTWNSENMGPLASSTCGPAIGMQDLGAIDAKITSHMRTLDPKYLQGSIIAGPTTVGGLPTFKWSNVSQYPIFAVLNHEMHKDEFNFDWVDVVAVPATIRVPTNDNQGTAIAVVLVLSILLVGIFVVLFVRLHVFKIGAPVDEVSPLTSA